MLYGFIVNLMICIKSYNYIYTSMYVIPNCYRRPHIYANIPGMVIDLVSRCCVTRIDCFDSEYIWFCLVSTCTSASPVLLERFLISISVFCIPGLVVVVPFSMWKKNYT